LVQDAAGTLHFEPGGVFLELEMPFLVQGRLDDITLTATTETPKDAFAKAIEWKVAERFADISISHGNYTYSIDQFASVMARLEIEKTVGRTLSK
jgi:hypothetical protein